MTCAPKVRQKTFGVHVKVYQDFLVFLIWYVLYATANPTVRETITRNSSTPTQMDVDGLGRGSFFPGTNISARPAPNANPYHKTAARTKATITPQDGTNARA